MNYSPTGVINVPDWTEQMTVQSRRLQPVPVEVEFFTLTVLTIEEPLYCPVHGKTRQRAFYSKRGDNVPLCGLCAEKFLDNLKPLGATKPANRSRYDIAKGKK